MSNAHEDALKEIVDALDTRTKRVGRWSVGALVIGALAAGGWFYFVATSVAALEERLVAVTDSLGGAVDSLRAEEARLLSSTTLLARVAAFVTAADQDRGGPGATDIGGTVSRLETLDLVALRGQTVLWVDDENPGTNSYERRALEILGLDLELVTTTEQVTARIDSTFALIITDFRRPSDPQAAYSVIESPAVQQASVPVIIYTLGATAQHRLEAVERGAFGQADQPAELIELVSEATQGCRPYQGRALQPSVEQATRGSGQPNWFAIVASFSTPAAAEVFQAEAEPQNSIDIYASRTSSGDSVWTATLGGRLRQDEAIRRVCAAQTRLGLGETAYAWSAITWELWNR